MGCPSMGQRGVEREPAGWLGSKIFLLSGLNLTLKHLFGPTLFTVKLITGNMFL